MRPFVLCALLCLSLSALTGQPSYAVADIPPSCLSHANSVIRQHETILRINQPGEAELEEWVVVTILNKAGVSQASWSEYEDEFVKIKSLKGNLYDAEGHLIRESDKKDVRDYGSFSDYEYLGGTSAKVLEMESAQFPFTVEFRVRKIIKGFFRIPDFIIQNLGQSVMQSSYRLVVPSSYVFNWKGIHTEVQPDTKESGGEKVCLWNFPQVLAVPNEPFNSYFRGEYAKIIVAPRQVLIDGHSGNFDDWKHIGQFFYDLNRERDILSPEMQQTIRNLVAGKATTRDKVDVLYRYLQHNHRYVSIQIGIGGWQTLDAAFVEKKKYGDCKALSNYMHAMLKTAGIESYMVDIYAGSSGRPDWYDDVPIPYANHVILYLPGEDMWLECTSNNAPTGYLGDFTAGRPALLLTPQGGKLVHTPEQTASDNTQTSLIDIQLEETGGAAVRSTIHTTCDLHEPYRSWLTQKKQPEIEKEFVENADFQIANLQNLRVVASDAAPLADMEYSLKINNLATKSGKRMFVPVNKINSFKRALPANEKRVLDLKMRDAYTWKDTVLIRIPEGYQVENLPPDKHIQSAYGTFDFKAIRQDSAVSVIRYIQIQPVAVPAAQYNDVRQFYQDVTKADGAQMVLVKN